MNVENMSDLELLEYTFKRIGIEYHKIVSQDDPSYVYIQKLNAHDEPGKIYVMGYGLIPLTSPNQLSDFFEFENGSIASW